MKKNLCVGCGRAKPKKNRAFCSMPCYLAAIRNSVPPQEVTERARKGLCIKCGRPRPADNHSFCSIECYRGTVRKVMPSPGDCLVCGEPRPPTNSVFCSMACYKLRFTTAWNDRQTSSWVPMPPPAENVHPSVKALFSEMHMQRTTLEMISARSNVSANAIKAWRRGQTNPTVDTLQRVYSVLGMGLVGITEDMKSCMKEILGESEIFDSV